MTLLPFVLVRLEGFSATAAGAALLPLPLIIGFGSPFVGRWTAKHGVRLTLTGGATLVAIGLALMARVGTGDVSYFRDVLPPICLVAVGMAVSVAPLTTAVMAAVDQRHAGAASGVNSAVARLGGLIATALLGFVFAQSGSSGDISASIRMAALIGASWTAAAALCSLLLVGRTGQTAREA